MSSPLSNTIHQRLLKYDFHIFLFIFFALVCYNLDGYFKNIQSTIYITEKYWVDPDSGVFWGETAFIVLCYAAAVFVQRKTKLKKYFIIPLLALDILALFTGTWILLVFTGSTAVSPGSSANIIIALLLVALKDWLIVVVARRKTPEPANIPASYAKDKF